MNPHEINAFHEGELNPAMKTDFREWFVHRLENTIFVMLNSHENCYAGTNSCFL